MHSNRSFFRSQFVKDLQFGFRHGNHISGNLCLLFTFFFLNRKSNMYCNHLISLCVFLFSFCLCFVFRFYCTSWRWHWNRLPPFARHLFSCAQLVCVLNWTLWNCLIYSMATDCKSKSWLIETNVKSVKKQRTHWTNETNCSICSVQIGQQSR